MYRGYTSPGIRRHRSTLRILCLFLFLLLVAPTRGWAQTPRDQVLDFLDAASGFQLLGEIITGVLQTGEDMATPVTLVEGGDYMMVGYCSSGCTNLDLALFDSFGERVESDTLPDAEPVLMFRAEATGSFIVQATAVECPPAGCSLAVGIMGSTAEPGAIPGEDMAGRLTLVAVDLMSLGFSEIGDERVGSLNNDQSISLPINLEAGREYRLVGVCDRDCFDLDLALVSPRGEEVASDVLEDALPIVAHVADTTADYRVEVIMIACGLEPCAFRVAAYARGEAMGPGGASFTGELLFHETHYGELGPGDQEVEKAYLEVYEVEARAGQSIIADLRSDDFDTLLRVRGPGDATAENDDFGFDTGHSHIEMLVEEDGTYFVHVTSFSPESAGAFVLQVAVVG
ncbi:MAG: hypothetical protein HKO65_11465 [Gemmatimonadetes bacterium]|nr:hypothetical protein [Gemmatimonadota bacterium]